MTTEGFHQKRLQDLANNIAEELELLNDYEDELRFERDPRIIGKYRRDIKRQQQAIANYKQEYAELQNLLGGSSSAQVQEVGKGLEQIQEKIETVQQQLRSPQPLPESLRQRDETQRELWGFVHKEVKNRLKHSLDNRIFITLDKTEDYCQVNPPWAIDIKIGTGEPERLPSNTKITEIYDREDIDGRLLILGAPGSGKTTTLLQLAQDLISRAQEDSNQPIPVLLNLSSWKEDKQSIKDWIIDDLKQKYGVRKDIGKKWLEQAVIIPLLDGLDELAPARQSLAVERINQFLQPSSWSSFLVVCSRTEEFERTATKLGLNDSIILQPFNNGQIQNYILQTEGEQLWDSIKDDPSFMDLAQTPLFLTIIVISCEKISFYQWQKLESASERLRYLFDAYIERMLSREYKGKQPIPDKTRHWLGWLADQLEQKQREFLIERMQPTWLPTNAQKVIYNLVFRLILGLISGLAMILHFGTHITNDLPELISLVIPSAISGLITGLSSYYIPGLVSGLIFMLTIALVVSKSILKEVPDLPELFTLLSPLLIDGMSWGVYLHLVRPEIGFIDNIKWSWLQGQKFSFYGLVGGVIYVLIRLIFAKRNYVVNGYHFIVYELLIFWLLTGLVGAIAIISPEKTETINPNQGILKAAKSASILFAIFFLTGTLIALPYYLEDGIHKVISTGLAVGLFAVVVSGRPPGVASGRPPVFLGLVVIQHFSLRVVLWFSGYIPWNYARFLDYATDRLFLQRVGGGYQFIHRLLQEHFAQMWEEEQIAKKSN